MKLSIYTVANILIIFFLVGIYFFVHANWYKYCTEINCTSEMTALLLRPLLSGSLALIPSFALLLFFPPKIFKYCLFGILSWAIPLIIYSVSQVDINASSVLSVRANDWAVILFGFLYFFIMICIGAGYGYAVFKKKLPKKEFLRLLLFIPAVASWYVFYY